MKIHTTYLFIISYIFSLVNCAQLTMLKQGGWAWCIAYNIHLTVTVLTSAHTR